jgi:RNA ligase (TIGR02306 family)
MMSLCDLRPSGMRKLASIREIAEVRAIAGADNIEVAQIDGWQVVVKRGEFKPGDACLYHEIDSFLPAALPQYEFLMARGVTQDASGNRGMRLRTVKLRNQISQGLALPVGAFFAPGDVAIGDDVAERLGIIKWEPAMPACLAGEAKGVFPAWIRKTDQERIQNAPHLLADGEQWEVTVKLDGSSCTIYHRDGETGVCSRNLDLRETDGNTFWKVARQNGLPDKLAAHGNIAVQGELIGEGIQGNPEKIKGHDFYVFDVWLIDESRYMVPDERYALCESLGLKHVPIEHVRATAPSCVEHALALADGPSLNPQTRREGLVWKSRCGKKSWKAISNRHLLEEK